MLGTILHRVEIRDECYMAKPLIFNKHLTNIKELLLIHSNMYHIFYGQARTWGGEKGHCPQKAGKLPRPQITGEQPGNQSSSTKTW